jgi:hypothetical protein
MTRCGSPSAPQFDDLAILVVRRSPAPERAAASEARLDLEGRTAELARGRAWMQEWCASRGVDADAVQDLDLALDEVVANIIHHGYGPEGRGRIGLRLALLGDVVRLEVSDRAPPSTSAPVLEAASAAGQSLGVHSSARSWTVWNTHARTGENRLSSSAGANGRAPDPQGKEPITMSLSIQVRQTTIVTLAGRLDTASSPRAEQALAPVLAAAPKHVVFDLAGLDFISSAGLRVLLGARKTLTNAGSVPAREHEAPDRAGAR